MIERSLNQCHKFNPEILHNNIDSLKIFSMKKNRSTDIAVAVFAAKEEHHHDTFNHMCGTDSREANKEWASNVS
jgi:hypothetical protein